ncbi:MAG: MipA/OmpV family protein, partial [Burkholderiaceae bacterium]
MGNPLQGMKFAPRFGLRYGKWKLGIGDGREWLQFSGFVAERGLSYQVTESDRWQLNASARAFNASTGSRYDINEPDSLKGKLGIQATGSVNFALTPVWSAGVSVTHDLLGDGNGQTVGVGVSRAISMGETRVLYLSAGVTWGSAQHWQTAHDRGGHPQATLASGLGLLGLGLAYRHALSPTHAWYAKANTGVKVGQDVSMDRLRTEHDAVVVACGVMSEEEMRALGVTGTDKGVSVDPKTYQTRVEGVFSAGSAVKKDLPVLRSVQQAKAKAACIS